MSAYMRKEDGEYNAVLLL